MGRPFHKSIQRILRECDVILEVVDARFISETRNERLEQEILDRGKDIIYVINKIDLIKESEIADELKTMRPYVLVSCTERLNTGKLRNLIKKVSNKYKAKIGIVGYPNTGKSSLINTLCGRAKARTSSQSGMTRGVQYVKLSENMYLLDSPGTFEDKEKGGLALSSSIDFSKIKDPEECVEQLMEKFPGVIEGHFEIDDLEELALRMGFLKKGGVADEKRAARYILKEWQQGKIHV